MLSQKEKTRLKKISNILYSASKDVRILKHLRWPESVRFSFFRSKSEKLPEVNYAPFDESPVIAKLSNGLALLKDTPFDFWLRKKAKDIEAGARLLKVCGTKSFFERSAQIYGLPLSTLHDNKTTPLDLATKFEKILDAYSKSNVKITQPYISAEKVQNKSNSGIWSTQSGCGNR